MLPGADIFFFLSFLGEMYPKCPYSTLNGRETPSAPSLHHCVLFSHFTGELWMNQTEKVSRESRNDPAESYEQLISSPMANANCFEP